MDLIDKVIERESYFWALVDIRKGCWNWTGGIDKDGYGYFYIGHNKHIPAHRVSYMLKHHEDIDGKIIRHTCDNKTCVNPAHLKCGTHADNVRDRVKRGRSAIGSHNGRSKLTEEIVYKLRYDLMKKYSKHYLAQKYNISRKTLRGIAQGKTWKHVKEIK